jgi:hypothetical protein
MHETRLPDETREKRASTVWTCVFEKKIERSKFHEIGTVFQFFTPKSRQSKLNVKTREPLNTAPELNYFSVVTF